MSGRKTLGKFTIFRVFLRSFFLQSAMNYERMQNLGFAFAIQPAVDELYTDEARREAMLRHLGFFNSNPYLSASILGAVLSLEERYANHEVDVQEITDFKQFMMGPIAALGDSFFWTSLKPLAASWAVLAALCGVLWAPIAFLVLYNSIQMSVRFYGVFRGYALGEEVCLKLQEFALVRMSDRAQFLTAIMLGGSGAMFVKNASFSAAALEGPLEVFLFGSLVLIFLLGLRRKIDATILLYFFGGGTFVLLSLLNAWFPLT